MESHRWFFRGLSGPCQFAKTLLRTCKIAPTVNRALCLNWFGVCCATACVRHVDVIVRGACQLFAVCKPFQ